MSISLTLNFPLTEQNTRVARDLLEKAVQLDPGSAEAAAWLADLTLSDYLNCWNGAGAEELEQASNFADQAMVIDANLPLAHYVRGFVHRANGNHSDALAAFTRARTLDPAFARAFAHEGAQQINLGQWDAGRQLVQQAITLCPNDASIGVFYWMIGRAYFFESATSDDPAATYDDAVTWLENSVTARPNLWYNRLYLVSAYQLNNRPDDAANALRDFQNQFLTFSRADVTTNELNNPNDNPLVIQGRNTFIDALDAVWT